MLRFQYYCVAEIIRFAEFWKGIPAAVQQYRHDLDLMLIGNGKKLVNPFDKTLTVLLPRQILQIHPYNIESDI